MLHRRSTAIALVALLPLVGALTSCAEEPRTNQVNTIGAGVNEREASVDVLGARILAFSDGKGRLIGTLVYNENGDEPPARLVEVLGTGVTVGTQEAAIEVPPNRSVNLSGDDVAAIPVEGEFAPGDLVELTYSFDTDESVTLEVPVVKPCFQYADIAEPEFEPAAAEETASPEVEVEGEEGEDHAEDATYLCEQSTEAAEGEEGGH